MWYARIGTAPFRVLLATLATAPSAAMEWSPHSYAPLSTIELRTNCPSEGEYWSKVWVVSVDDQVYVRLGSRAAGRIACNASAPYIGVRIGQQEFDHVRTIESPESAPRVARAMAAKYWSDLVVHLLPHPMTLRLVAE